MTPRTNAKDVSQALAGQIEQVCSALGLGDPTNRTGHELRYRGKGSLAVTIKGDKRGLFYDHEAGTGGDPIDLIAHVMGCDFKTALAWGEGHFFVPPSTVPRPTPSPLPRPTHYPLPRPAPAPSKPGPISAADAIKSHRAIQDLWTPAIPIAGTLAEEYLLNVRGVKIPDRAREALRFMPEVTWSDKGAFHKAPAMVALMTDPATNKPCGVHVTHLTSTGKKHPVAGKRMRGRRGVVMLWPDDAATTGLFLTEGIETALAAWTLCGFEPIWAATCAGGVASFPVLGGVECLHVLADADQPGIDVARQVTTRWQEAGREAMWTAFEEGDFADRMTPDSEGDRHVA
jgi:hypothetical protein